MDHGARAGGLPILRAAVALGLPGVLLAGCPSAEEDVARLAGRVLLADVATVEIEADAREFGTALAASGGRILVGAPGTADGAGAAFLLDGELARVAAGDDAGDRMGAAVALDGRWYVGAPHAGERQEVAAASLGTGVVVADGERWDGAQPGDCFGSALAARDGRLLVGAPCRGSYAFQHESLPRPMLVDGPGVAFLFGDVDAEWAGIEAWDTLGHAVALTDVGVVLGAPDYFGGDWINQTARGEVHVVGSPSPGTHTIADADTVVVGGQGSRELHDDHGWSVASGDLDDDGGADLVIGAPGFDDFERQGGGWLFTDLPSGEARAWDGAASLAGEPQDGTSARTGASVAVADVDCDGVDDLILGAPMRTTDADRAGAVYVAYGPLSGWTPLAEAGVVLEGRGLGSRVGEAVAATDIDGDGCDDVVIGAPGAAGGAGRVWVVPLAGRP